MKIYNEKGEEISINDILSKLFEQNNTLYYDSHSIEEYYNKQFKMVGEVEENGVLIHRELFDISECLETIETIEAIETISDTNHNITPIKYNEDDLIDAARYGYEFRNTTSFPEYGFDQGCLNNTKQWIIGILNKNK